jgi:cytochrome b561
MTTKGYQVLFYVFMVALIILGICLSVYKFRECRAFGHSVIYCIGR